MKALNSIWEILARGKNPSLLTVRPLTLLALTVTLLWVSVSVYAAGSFEFSEGEDEIINVGLAMRIADSYREPLSLVSVFIQERSPFAYLFAVPFLWIFPVNEFTLRLPYALFGILQLPLVFGIAKMLFNTRVGVIAAVLLAASGLFAVNRLALGISFFMFLELLALYWFIRFARFGDSRAIIWAFGVALIATLTFQDGIFFAFSLGVLAILMVGLTPQLLIGIGIYVTGNVLYLLGAIVGSYGRATWLGEVFNIAEVGAIRHLIVRSGGFSITNAFDLGYFQSMAYYISTPLSIVVLLGLAYAIMRTKSPSRTGLYLLFGFILPHAFMWNFMTARFEHPVFIFPVITILAAQGLCLAIGSVPQRLLQVVAASLIAVIVLASIGWNQIYFNSPNWSSTSKMSKLILEWQHSLPRGHGELSVLGYKTTGWLLRETTIPTDTVYIANTMSGALEYYADRSTEKLTSQPQGQPSLQDLNGVLVVPAETKFLADARDYLAGVSRFRIMRDGATLLWVFDLRNQRSHSSEPFTMDSYEYDRRFDAKYNKISDFLDPFRRPTQ